MRHRTFYAVVASENDVTDATALFQDEDDAERWADKLNHDPDYNSTEYGVLEVEVATKSIVEV